MGLWGSIYSGFPSLRVGISQTDIIMSSRVAYEQDPWSNSEAESLVDRLGAGVSVA